MAKLTTLQSFRSVDHLKQTFGVLLPKPHDWRLLNLGIVGAINGIPTSQGVAIATNGILVAIIQQSSIFIGHMDSFVADEQQPVTVLREAKATRATKQPKVDISEFV